MHLGEHDNGIFYVMMIMMMMIMMIMRRRRRATNQTKKAHLARRQPGKKSTNGSTTLFGDYDVDDDEYGRDMNGRDDGDDYSDLGDKPIQSNECW